MASSGSGGDRSQAPRAVMEDLINLRKSMAKLQTMLEGTPTPPSAAGRDKLIEGAMSSLSSAMSALNTNGGGDGGASSSAGGRGSGGRRRRGAAAVATGGPHRRSSSSCRRRTQSPLVKTVTAPKLEDDHAWRKYGQKHIQESHNPRSYYRCTHMADQGCKAKKQVQVSETNPWEYIISYFGQHTCRDPSTIPLIIDATTAAPSNFISFGSTVNGASTSSAHAVIPHHQAAVNPIMMLSRFGYSSLLPAQERCGSEEAISSFSPDGELSAVVGSAGKTSTITVGSAPEQWLGGGSHMPAGGIDTGSFQSSPSSHELMTGSFESFGNSILDDDMFGFDL